MGDPQERTVGKAFVAGLIVGEGCFCLAAQNRKATTSRPERLSIYPSFFIGMNDEETMTLLYNTLRAEGIGCYWSPRYEYHHKKLGDYTQSRIQVNGMKRIEKLIRWLRDDLTGEKKQAADLVMEFIESRKANGNYKMPYSENEKEIVRKLRAVNGTSPRKRNPL